MIRETLRKYEIPFREQSGQIRVACPACGKDWHAYIDPTKKVYFCQKCGASGTFNQFLAAVTGVEITQPTGEQRKKRFRQKNTSPLATNDFVDPEEWQHANICSPAS